MPQTRLGIAGRVAAGAPGRALILQSIFMAGVDFTAQHFYPVADQWRELQRMIPTYLWE